MLCFHTIKKEERVGKIMENLTCFPPDITVSLELGYLSFMAVPFQALLPWFYIFSLRAWSWDPSFLSSEFSPQVILPIPMALNVINMLTALKGISSSPSFHLTPFSYPRILGFSFLNLPTFLQLGC